MENRFKPTKWLKGSLLVAGIALSLSVFEAQAWVSVPSAMQDAQVVISGGDLTAGALVTVQITDPVGQSYTQADVVKSDGTFATSITPSMDGKYRAEVFDANGQAVGGGDFIYAH